MVIWQSAKQIIRILISKKQFQDKGCHVIEVSEVASMNMRFFVYQVYMSQLHSKWRRRHSQIIDGNISLWWAFYEKYWIFHPINSNQYSTN